MKDFKAVTSWLAGSFPEVDPLNFYRDLFPAGELERRGEYIDGMYCGIAIQVVRKDKAKRYSVTDDLDVIRDLIKTNDFCIMSPVSYAGKTQSQNMARYLYAVTIDLDGIVIEDDCAEGLDQLWYQMTQIRETVAAAHCLPVPTYIVASGRGVHLYYMLKKPIPLFRNVIKQLQALRSALISQIWNSYVTTLSKNPQFESVTQGFRMVGSITKDGERVRAFRTGEKVSIEYLNEHVWDSAKVTTFAYRSTLTLKQAKEQYPEWYQSRIVEKNPPGTWTVKRDLYDWWKRKILDRTDGAREGHRYFCIMALAIYARKCGIDREELEKDALSLINEFNRRGNQDKNPFTAADVVKALEAYDAIYQRFPRKNIEELTSIEMPPNKRNGRKRHEHITLLNATRKIRRDMFGDDEYKNSGRPDKAMEIIHYAAMHPKASQREIAAALGVSKTTVNKWLKKK